MLVVKYPFLSIHIRKTSEPIPPLMKFPCANSLQVVPFSAKDLAELKSRAMEGGVLEKVSTFEALAGHIWQARIKANDAKPNEVAQLLYAVDVRDRLDPPLPKGFVGNALYSACARATCEEVRNGPLSFCVEQIQQANRRVTNDYIRYIILILNPIPASPVLSKSEF